LAGAIDRQQFSKRSKKMGNNTAVFVLLLIEILAIALKKSTTPSATRGEKYNV
jgi:hypothetical protein